MNRHRGGYSIATQQGSTVAWVALAGLDDHVDLEQTVASALGLHDRPGITPADSLRDAIADDRVCLILDNFEQIIDAAPRIVDLLHACPRFKIFVTSRERLRVRGEREFPREPLTVPTITLGHDFPGIDANQNSPAVSLLIDRARDILPEFRINEKNALALSSICSSLDGLPIESECKRLGYRFEQPEWNVLQSNVESIRAACSRQELQIIAEADVVNGETALVELAREILGTVSNDIPLSIDVSAFPDLISRELEVLVLVANATSDHEIGDQLSISHRTVMRHVANMLPKPGVSSRTIAAALWHQQMTSRLST